MNNIKVFGLMALLTGLVVALGGAVGGQSGMVLAFVMAAVMNVGMFWLSSTMVVRMYKSPLVTAADAPGLYEMVARLQALTLQPVRSSDRREA